MTYSDDYLRGILNRTRRLAIVGISPNPVRPSYFVGAYMANHGYSVVPVRPGMEGQELFDHPVRESLSAIPPEDGDIQMVDIFRRSEHVLPIVEEAIAALAGRGLQTIWMQIGVVNHEAAALAERHGLAVVMDRCPKMEYQRLVGELSWGGINSGIISSKRR